MGLMTPGLTAPPPDHARVWYSELTSRSAKMSVFVLHINCLVLCLIFLLQLQDLPCVSVWHLSARAVQEEGRHSSAVSVISRKGHWSFVQVVV